MATFVVHTYILSGDLRYILTVAMFTTDICGLARSYSSWHFLERYLRELPQTIHCHISRRHCDRGLGTEKWKLSWTLFVLYKEPWRKEKIRIEDLAWALSGKLWYSANDNLLNINGSCDKIGSVGHAVVPILHDALQNWSGQTGKTISYIHKGMDCLTEMYSAVKPEVDFPSHMRVDGDIGSLHTYDPDALTTKLLTHDKVTTSLSSFVSMFQHCLL